MTRTVQPPSTCSSLLVQLRDAGDVAAWRTFVDLYTPLVYGYARRRGLQDADAQDVVQQLFIQVSQAIRGFDYDPARGRFRNWLGVLTARAVARHLRRVGQVPGMGIEETNFDLLEGEVAPDWIDDFNGQVCRVAMQRIQSEIDPFMWQVFEMTWVGEQDPREVAHAVQKPVAWVYKVKFKVLRRLKDEVQFLCQDAIYFSDE